MSDSPLQKKSNGKEADIQFTTDNIGRWASRQENPFAEQNRKEQAKKQERAKKRKKFSPIVIISASAIAIITAVVGLVFLIINLTGDPLPEDIAMGSEGATQVSDSAQKVFNDFINKFYSDKNKNPSNGGDSNNNGEGENGDGDNTDIGSVENPSPEAIQGAIDAVNDYFNNRTDATTNDPQRIDLVLVEMSFYAGNGHPQEVIDAAEKVNTDNMTDMQRGQYWGMLMNASTGVGNNEAADHYLELLSGLPQD